MAGAARPVRRAGEPPDPAGAWAVEELTARLRALRTWAGLAYRSVHRKVGRDRAARRRLVCIRSSTEGSAAARNCPLE